MGGLTQTKTMTRKSFAFASSVGEPELNYFKILV